MTKKQEDKNDRRKVFRSVGYGVARRNDRRSWVAMVGVFAMVFVFAFLMAKYKDNNVADAANLGAFDAGYIMSDYQMGNYNSMSEADIQNFLKQKGNCNDTRTYLADYYTSYSYHIRDGHFVCLADETFGDGTAYGNSAPNGASAAHIIWQAAQDYRINPQVIIVLLQKEQGLITDSWPNNRQYRSATGYGCPDTAACDSKYYGFKNQVRQAAAMFRTVLDGGWTNYPLGWNYVQYNPDVDCGGSWVNIRSLATSALYRYTPYQPNSAALAAGYGTGDSCSAYGNRNFYSYFEDWFGGITSEDRWVRMETPRHMVSSRDTVFYDLSWSTNSSIALPYGKVNYYVAKTFVNDGRMCLRTIEEESANGDKCVMYDDLREVNWNYINMDSPRYLESKDSSSKIDPTTKKRVAGLNRYEFYDQKIFLPDGDMCLKSKEWQGDSCVLYSSLKEAEFDVYSMDEPRYLVPRSEAAPIINLTNNEIIGYIQRNEKRFYDEKIITPGGQICLRTRLGDKYDCVLFKDLSEVWVNMEYPREMRMVKESYKIDAIDSKIDYGLILPTGMIRMYVKKRYILSHGWCLQTEYDSDRATSKCILFSELGEVNL